MDPASNSADAPIVFLIHGAGFTALTWSFLVHEMASTNANQRIVALDLIGHGDTASSNDHPVELSMEDLCRTSASLINRYLKAYIASDYFVFGHSLGGSIAIKMIHDHILERDPMGTAVVDIVEETAINALSNMSQILAQRPKTFSNAEELIHWG
jgi:protein phosphatase methylesterase 1